MTSTNSDSSSTTNQPSQSPDPKQQSGSRLDHSQQDHTEAREHHLDKTIEDSFPASDPPSTDPNPDGDD
jgi:hypothetical protein